MGFLAIFFGWNIAQAEEVKYHIPAPTILEAAFPTGTNLRPTITGVTFNQTLVDVYINGVFYGRAETKQGLEGVASFSFQPLADLVPGEHQVTTIARSLDETVRSQESEPLIFKTFLPTPPPYLLEPELQTDGLVKIIGLLRNGLEVEIYIEGVKQVSFTVPDHWSGTTNFWYRPHLPAGEYTVTTRAIDNTGKASVFSNSITMYVPQPEEVDRLISEKEKISQEDVVPKTTIEIKEEEPVEQEEEGAAPIVDEVAIDLSGDIKQGEKIEERTVAEIEEKLPDLPKVVEPGDSAKVVVDTRVVEGQARIVDQPADSQIVLGDQPGETTILVDQESTDEATVFGEKQEIGEGAEESAREAVDQIQQRNRVTGFIILLVIAIVLAIWYVREKKQAEVAAKKEEKPARDKQDNQGQKGKF